MKKEILVNVELQSTKVAVVEDGHLEEYHVERQTDKQLVGSIFKGKVSSIVPGIGAAFGVFTTIASEIISSGVDVNTVFYAIARGIAGGVAQLLIVNFGLGVVMTGMIALVIWHVVCDAIYVVSGGIEAVPKIVYFVVVNTLFNFLVFTFFGNLLLKFAML